MKKAKGLRPACITMYETIDEEFPLQFPMFGNLCRAHRVVPDIVYNDETDPEYSILSCTDEFHSFFEQFPADISPLKFRLTIQWMLYPNQLSTKIQGFYWIMQEKEQRICCPSITRWVWIRKAKNTNLVSNSKRALFYTKDNWLIILHQKPSSTSKEVGWNKWSFELETWESFHKEQTQFKFCWTLR